MNLIRNVKVTHGASTAAIIIKTNKGQAKLSVKLLERIVELNIQEGAQSFGASHKIEDFLIKELA